MSRSEVTQPVRSLGVLVLALSPLALAACGSPGDGVQVDPAHTIVPTEQMIDLAEQQCLDDPTKEQGIIRAQDPNASASEPAFAEVVVECGTVRVSP